MPLLLRDIATPNFIGFLLLHLVASFLFWLHVLKTKREASSAILWMAVILIFPILGLLTYLTFGIDRVNSRKRRFALTSSQIARVRSQLIESGQVDAWLQARRGFLAKLEDPTLNSINFAFDRINPDLFFLAGNDVQPLVNGDEAYPPMLEAIDRATDHVHLQTYIIDRDETGELFMDHLRRKAESGVKVRLMYDRFGSARAHLSRFFKPFQDVPNLEIHGFTQASLLRRQFQVNLRNHRKILVTDGRTGFTGGINIHNGQSTRYAGDRVIRDYHFQVAGPAVYQLQYSFLRDWFYIVDQKPEKLHIFRYFPPTDPAGIDPVQAILSGPVSDYEAMTDAVFTTLSLARHSITIITPYFIPSIDILRALRCAALRGVEVKIIVPSKNNHWYVGLASRSMYEELLQSGVRIFERQPPFVHAKALLVDGEIALVGSANLDNRSLRLNHETNIAVLGRAFAERLQPILAEDFERSSEVILESFRNRSALVKIAENSCRLLSPML